MSDPISIHARRTSRERLAGFVDADAIRRMSERPAVQRGMVVVQRINREQWYAALWRRTIVREALLLAGICGPILAFVVLWAGAR